MITPSGRYLGRKKDSADPRDHRFAVAHQGVMTAPPPPNVDLGGGPAYDQGSIGSCGPNSLDRLMCFEFPEFAFEGFSRLQIYAGVRDLEGDFSTDGGVETRDLFRFVTNTGAMLESAWPYDVRRLFVRPPPPQPAYQLASYSRLGTEDEMLACLASGHKFVLGVNLFESFDGDALARTGVMTMPDPRREKEIGGHDVCVDGYDLDFRNNKAFRKSGVSRDLVSDQALLICNSWGAEWGIQGRFWMPLSYASNASTGGDAWTGRRYADAMPLSIAAVLPQPTPRQITAAITETRSQVDASGYGSFVSDDQCRQLGTAIARAVVQS